MTHFSRLSRVHPYYLSTLGELRGVDPMPRSAAMAPHFAFVIRALQARDFAAANTRLDAVEAAANESGVGARHAVLRVLLMLL